MKKLFTFRMKALAPVLLWLISFWLPNNVRGQANYAVNGICDHTGGGVLNGGFGPDLYIDNVIGTYPQTGTNTYGYTASGADIKFWWVFPIPPDSVKKIVFYNNDRPLTSCEVWYWDGQTNTYDSITSYFSLTPKPADSLFLPRGLPIRGSSDTIILRNVQSVMGNPSLREIQLWNVPNCSGTPSNSIKVSGLTASGYQTSTTNITVCLGTMITLNAESAYFSSGHGYQWQIMTSSSGVWTDIPGANSPGVTVPAMMDAQYRVVDTCLFSGQVSPTLPVTVVVGAATYKSVPVFEDFENWQSECIPAPFSFNIPSAGWINTYAMGDSSWRISTQNSAPGSTQTDNTAGWTNPTSATLSPQAKSGTYSARAHTTQMSPFVPANLDLYVDCSGPGGKQLYFYMQNNMAGLPGNDSLRVLLSTDNGATFTRLAAWDTATQWKRRSLPIASTSAQTIVRFQAIRINTLAENSDIGIDSVFIAAPCSGTPVAGKLTASGTVNGVCAGSSFHLTTNGTSMAGGLVYTWEQSTDGTTFTAVTGGHGYNTLFFETPPLYDTISYRLKVQCGATGTAVYTDTIRFNVATLDWASIPFKESFETWGNGCANSDRPLTANNEMVWANTPAMGWNSWRRDDQGITSSWFNPGLGGYSPSAGPAPSPTNQYSARFHSSGSVIGTFANLDLLVDLSTSPGDKELSFFYINTTGDDSLEVYYSPDEGGNFTKLGGYRTNNDWTQYTVQVPSSGPKSVIRFKAYGHFGNTSDIGLDSLVLLPGCNGQPVAGVISTALPCAGEVFTLTLSGYSVGGSINYLWQSAPSPNGPWQTAGPNKVFLTTSVNQPTYFRVVATCLPTGQSDTSAIRYINLKNFYYCYCESGATTASGSDIGNFRIQRLPGMADALSNGSPTPYTNNPQANRTYTNYIGLIPPVVMYHDSVYAFYISQINSGGFVPSTASIWIDTNRNGSFDHDELFYSKTTSNTTFPPQRVADTFLIPSTTPVGITGLRIVLEEGINPSPSSCGAYSHGETEDYLVEIRYPPCDGPLSPGTTIASDTASCPNYLVTVYNTTHERERSDISWVWQYSPDGNSWANVQGSDMKDTIRHMITGPSYFRLRMLCLNTYDTTLSNMVKVSVSPPFSCYCYSEATGGDNDLSDIGALTFGNLTIPGSGPHLLNQHADQSRTDYTRLDTLHLWVDSSYRIEIYHIMKSASHQDAKITLFVDMNNDMQYTVTSSNYELLWTGYSNSSYFTVIDSVYIPLSAIPNVYTGMRLILNNDTGPNAPSDSGCGPYTSGETEDFIVFFHPKAGTEVKGLDNIAKVAVFPNPTGGKFTLTFNARRPVLNAEISVTNVTGQVMKKLLVDQPGMQFAQNIDLSGFAAGVYFVELKADQERVVRKLVVK